MAVVSTQFDTERMFDIVTIHNVPYSGRIGDKHLFVTNNVVADSVTVLEQIVPSQFIVSFKSDTKITKTGFVLKWECISGKS